jgi:hypothetical protein
MNKTLAIICLMILCSFGTAMADYTANVTQDVTIESVGGTYTGTSLYAGYSTSYGIENTLLTYNQPSLPAGQTISDVTLNFDVYSVPSSSHTLNIYSNPNTTWSPSTVTYNNFGNSNNSLISQISSPGKQWYSVDVTSYVESQLAAGNNSFTFVIGTADASQDTSNAYYGIESDRYSNGTYQSYLDYQTTAATPIPAGIWLFGSGLAGLVGIKKRIG